MGAYVDKKVEWWKQHMREELHPEESDKPKTGSWDRVYKEHDSTNHQQRRKDELFLKTMHKLQPTDDSGLMLAIEKQVAQKALFHQGLAAGKTCDTTTDARPSVKEARQQKKRKGIVEKEGGVSEAGRGV